MEFTEKLLSALKKDDKKSFDSCMQIDNCGSLRMGRFPVLSLMYLYNARRLISAYEKQFVRYNSWRDIGEPAQLSAQFRRVAGKCLRLYLNETVSPVEMLLLLNQDSKFKRTLAAAHATAPVKQRLKDIYYVKWGLQAQISGNKITLQRRPKTRAERARLLTACVAAVMCVILVVTTPFVINAFAPFITDGSGVINVSRWEQIKFKSSRIYSLTNDVTVSDKFYAEEMNCQLRGNGHTVTVTGNGLFGTVNGSLKDIVFNTKGNPIAQTVALRATVDGITVNAAVNVQMDKSCGLFANDNYGTIADLTVNASGTLSATAPQAPDDAQNETVSLRFGGVVANNNTTKVGAKTYYAALSNCSANYNDFSLQGQTQADAAFGGIVGQNDGLVQNCQVTGQISADIFDVAGICVDNNYGLTDSVNEANITQNTTVDKWYPIVSGIVINNYYLVDNCVNSGNVSASGVLLVQASGIVNFSMGDVHHSANLGDIAAHSQAEAHAGGIVGQFGRYVSECFAAGSINVSGVTCYAGGIFGYSMNYVEQTEDGNWLYSGTVNMCVAACDITVTTTQTAESFAAVGGIVACVDELKATIFETGEQMYIGGYVNKCYFTGKLSVEFGYAGALAGFVGNNIYNATANGKENSGNFVGNKYLDSCGVGVAFGAALTVDNEYKPVTDVGAAAQTLTELKEDATYASIMKYFEQLLAD